MTKKVMRKDIALVIALSSGSKYADPTTPPPKTRTQNKILPSKPLEAEVHALI